MAAIDELSTFAAPEDPYRTVGDNDIGLSDYVRKFAADAYAVPGQLAGAAEYAFRIPSGTDLEGIRDWSDEAAKAQIRKMSPGAQRNLQATFLPGEGPTIFDKDISTGHALGLRAVGAIPSVLASIIPGAMVARVAGATAGALAGGTVAAGQTAGDTYNNIVESFRDTPDDQLREQSPAYQGFRNMGMSEREARERLVETVTSYKPALMGAITLVTSRYGVEGLVAHRAAGEAGRGFLRGVGVGVAGEATQEAIESGSQEALEQQAGFDLRGVQGEYNWAKILEQAVGGAAVGGIIGGAVGGATAIPGRSGGRRKTRDEILGREPEEAAVPVGVAPTAVSTAQSTPEVLAEVRTKLPADRDSVVAEQNNPVKAGEEMGAAIAQKQPETHGGVDLKPAEPTPALTPAPLSADPEHVVALASPASVPQTIAPKTKLADRIAAIRLANPSVSYGEALVMAEGEDMLGRPVPATPEPIPPIPEHSVVTPEIAAAITHERATSIAQGTINAKLDEARATQNAPRPDPAAALAAAAAPAATGVTEPAATPVAPAVGLAGAAPSAPDVAATPVVGAAETPVTSIPSEVIPPTVEAPPVKRKPGRPRKNTAAPATPGQSAPNDAETQAAKEKAVTDDAVARIAEIIRGREAALASVTDFSEGVPIATEAANRIGDIQDAAVATLGKAKAYKLADKAREFLKTEREATRPAPAVAAEPVLDIEPAPAPTKGRILKDELQARKERKGPRETAAKKAQRERGETEILGKAEDEARLRQRALAEVAASVRKAFDEVTYDRAEMSTAKAQRDYMKALVKAVPLPDEPGKSGKKLSLANLPADAPGELRHLVAAKALSQGAGNEAQRFDFMANDIALREGTNLATEYASTQAGKGGASYDEDIHGARAAGETMGRNEAEEEMLDEIDRRRVEAMNARSMDERAMMLKRIASAFEGGELSPEAQKKIELIRKLAASTTFEGERQAAAARELAIRERAGGEGMAKYVTAGKSKEGTFKAEKKARLTPAEIKARAAAARAGVQTKRESALEAGATARTEAEGEQQTEAIIRENFGDDDQAFFRRSSAEFEPEARGRSSAYRRFVGRRKIELKKEGKVTLKYRDDTIEVTPLADTVQDAMAMISKRRLRPGVERVLRFAEDNFRNKVPVYLVDPAEMYRLQHEEEPLGPEKRRLRDLVPQGVFVSRYGNNNYNFIAIRTDIWNDPNYGARVLVHESAHAELIQAARDNPDMRDSLSVIREEAIHAWKKSGKPIFARYGLFGDQPSDKVDVDEFIAELVSNDRLQEFLRRQPASRELQEALKILDPEGKILPQKSMWQAIVEYFSNLLGYKSKSDVSLLAVAMRKVEVLHGEVRTDMLYHPKVYQPDDTVRASFGDILEEVGPVARLRERIARMMEDTQGKSQVRHHSGRTVPGEHIGSVHQALNQIPLDKLNQGTRSIVEMARDNFDNTPPVYVVSAADLHYLYTGKRLMGDTRSRDILNKIPRGLWSVDRTGREQVLIREDIVSDRNTYASVLTHESAHSEIGLRAQFNPEVAWNVHEIRAEARKLWIAAGKPDVTYLNYGLHGDKERTTNEILMGESPNVDEFLAELVSNWRLQKFLFTAPASQELRVTLGLSTPDTITPKFTMWDTIMAYFGKVLGLAKPDISLLDVALRQFEVLNEYQAKTGKAADAAYFGEDTVEAARDLPKSLPAYLQRWGLTGGTVDQIVRWTHSVFKGEGQANPMKRFEKALQQMHATATAENKEGQQIAVAWDNLIREDVLEGQKAAESFHDANIYDYDPSKPMDQDPRLVGNKLKHVQRKAMFPQARENFLAMKPRTRELMERTSRYFKAQQVKKIDQSTRTILGALNKFTPAQINDITEATLNGKLTATDPDNPTGQSHQEMIDNDGVWKVLKGYFSELKARGMYFPLYRHGDWVVTTDPPLPKDLMGAKVIEDKTTRATKTLEWRGSESQQKQLRDNHDAFFEENQDPTQVSTRIVRYQPGTDIEISEANSRGHPHDIAYRSVVQVQGVYFFTSNADARRFIKQSADLNPDAKPLQKKNWKGEGGIGSRELTGLMSTIDSREDISDSHKALAKSLIREAAIQLMPGNRMQHRALKRRGVKGADMNLPLNTKLYSEAASSTLGKMIHMPAAREALADMMEQHKEGLENKQDPNNQLRGQIIDELTTRLDGSVIDTKANSLVVQNMMTATFSAKLLTLSYSMMNGTQTWMLTLPSLGSKYGNMASAAAIWNSYKAIGFKGALIDGLMNTARAMNPKTISKLGIDLADPWADIRKNVAKEKDGALLTAMFKEVLDVRGLADDASALEIEHTIGKGPFTSALGKVDRIARQLPFAIEAINRSVALVSAFRLQYEIDQNYDAAVQAAIDEIQGTQFNYSNYNQPNFFKKPILRPGTYFKKFAQNVFAMLARAIHQSFAGASKKERKQAQKLLMNFFGVTIAMAGTMGLPGLELLRVAFTLSAMLGFTDGWEDQERKLRRLLRDSIGKTPEELLSKGILSRAAGIDLSTRLGYADMFTFSEPKTMDAEGMHAYLWRLFAGAPGSVVSDFGSGISAAGNGDWAQAIIKMVPAKVVADIAKAARGRFDATTKEPMTSAEAVMQAVGFRSARLAERGEEVGAKVSQNKKFQARAKELNAAYLSASTKAELTKIKGQIIAHNKAVEEAKAGLRQKAYAPKTLDRIRDEKRARREELLGAD